MLTFAVIAAAGFAAYGPPTNEDAFAAYITPILAPVRQSGEVIREAEAHYRPDFPSDVILQRCVRKQDHKVILANGVVEFHGGYDCIFEVWPNGEPAFRTSGFFRHDGFDWVFHGPLQRARIPTPNEFSPLRGKGLIIEKSGSLNYDGNPQNPMNPDYDPYQDYFNDTGWDQEPPPRN